MSLTLEDKKAVVAEVADIASKALSAVIADYRGLSVSEMDELRLRARKENIYLKVVRNTLARRAMKGTEFECLTDDFKGPTIVAFSDNEPGSSARLFRNFAKDHEKFEVKALSLSGKRMGPEQLAAVSKLPTRDEALAQLLNVMIAPVTKLVRTINEPTTQMVRAFSALANQKQ